MQTSPDLPTTVDFGNNLVNYIEVNPDDVLAKNAQNDAKQSADAKPEVKKPIWREVPPPSLFSTAIPSYLLDIDVSDEEPTSEYTHALRAIEKLPNPPALPGFLAKPILNAATLIKDDNSVLNMPNHTVLNHLMTSSIRNNILAVSGTTRYKDKVRHRPESLVYLFPCLPPPP
jgi:hypothetical protein